MRPKSLPLSVRYAPPAPPPPRARRPAPERRRGLLDTLLTVPVVLLLPALLFPLLSAFAAQSPRLELTGTAAPAAQLGLQGVDFGPRRAIVLTWNSEPVEWLPAATSDKAGRFSVAVVLPADLAEGQHVLSATELQPGSGAVRFTVSLTVEVVSPTATAQPTPTPSPPPTTAPTPTLLPTATPSPTPTPSSTPSTPSPTPTPTPATTATPAPALTPLTTVSSACTSPVGFGAGATGGSTLTPVSTASELVAAASAGGKRIQLTSSAAYGVNGWLNIAANTTIESAPNVKGVIKGGALVKGVNNVILRNVAFRPSDLEGNASDVDALFLNGLRGSVNKVLVQNVTGIWGPDIGSMAILGDVNDVTVQCSLFGEGLYHSEHYEAGPGTRGHSMGFSIFQLDTAVDPADRITLYGNLITTSDRRMPVIHGARQVDLVNNVIYNWGRNSPDGNPRGLNIVGNVMKAGPNTERFEVWRSRPHSANPCCYQDSVYLSDNLAVGFAYSVDSSAAYLRETPAHALSVTPKSASQVTTFVAQNAGPAVRDAHDQRLVDNMLNGSGTYFNGQKYSTPKPTWQ